MTGVTSGGKPSYHPRMPAKPTADFLKAGTVFAALPAAEIAALAAECRFRDCRHEGEPDCAVGQALADETLDPTRFRNFTKMRREVEHLEWEQNTLARLEQKRRWKNIHKDMKKMYKQRW